MRKFTNFEHGVNLGGWLSQGQTNKEHLDSFITEQDIANIKKMGADHIRVPLGYEIVENEDGSPKPSGYEYIDNCIKWCKSNGLNMILDLHNTAGYIFDDFDNCRGFFYDQLLQARFLSLWDKLSARYGKYSDMLAFEILNEVVDPDVAEIWNDLADRAIKVIRSNTKDAWILLGGTRNNSIISLAELRAPYDNKIVFNFHCYEPLIFTHQSASWVKDMKPDFRISYPLTNGEYVDATLDNIGEGFASLISVMPRELTGKDFFIHYFKEATEIANKYDVPLYCGEYGVIDVADTASTLAWFKDIHDAFEEFGIARAVWSYKQMDYGITGSHYASIFSQLTKFL